MNLKLSLAALAGLSVLAACDPSMMGMGAATPVATTATGAPDLDSSGLDDGVEGIPPNLDTTDDDGSALDPELTPDDD